MHVRDIYARFTSGSGGHDAAPVLGWWNAAKGITLDRQFRLADLKDRFGVVARDGKKGARNLERDMLRGVGFERGR